MTMPSARRQRILQIIVDEYVRTPVPVSSAGVAREMSMAVSPATIRNDMAELEEEGYISRPHTSAGGVPTDKAYRTYVESLGNVVEPSIQVQEHIRRRFRQAHMDMETWSRLAVQLLAELMRTVAMATLPRAAEVRWKHLDLVQLQEFLALLVMVLQESRLRQQLLLLKEPITQDELTRVSNKLNTSFAGLSRQEIQKKNMELTPFEEEVTDTALDLLRADEEEELPLPYVDGLRHMFSYPELSVGSRAREVAEMVENQQLIRSVLEEVPETGVVRVTIGAENKTDRLRPFSIVFAQYGVPSDATGVVGVIGPTRMRYATAISSVRYFSSLMSEIVEAVRGRAS